jgi:cytochrome c-type biogenesis protein CcmH
VIARIAVALVCALALASSALASEEQPTLAELENEVYCPTCQTALALSSSPIAERMRAVIRQWIAEGDTKTEIKAKLVAEFGERVLAAPPKEGFNLIAWVLPIVGVVVAGGAVGFWAWRRSAASRGAGGAEEDFDHAAEVAIDPELERRLDEELARFDQ